MIPVANAGRPSFILVGTMQWAALGTQRGQGPIQILLRPQATGRLCLLEFRGQWPGAQGNRINGRFLNPIFPEEDGRSGTWHHRALGYPRGEYFRVPGDVKGWGLFYYSHSPLIKPGVLLIPGAAAGYKGHKEIGRTLDRGVTHGVRIIGPLLVSGGQMCVS